MFFLNRAVCFFGKILLFTIINDIVKDEIFSRIDCIYISKLLKHTL
jgi:hypothetical protein